MATTKKAPVELWNALIRTHHVTSRKKVSKLKKEAKDEANYVLIRSGGSPGLMYVEGDEEGVGEWVEAVHNLRYKDYDLVRKPAPLETRLSEERPRDLQSKGFDEQESVSAFALQIEKRGLLQWWREAMGYKG